MIAEILPESYDINGRRVFRPDLRRHSGFRPNFPPGRFISQPLKHWCSDLEEMRRSLADCTYVSDEKQFGTKDYWQPPEQFEESRKGDCEDFALWCWRQLMHMGYPARFVVGTAGRYGDGHAWVTFQKDGKAFLLEALNSPAGLKTPRLSRLRYHPKFSMSWDGETISYYSHQDEPVRHAPRKMYRLVAEWLLIWIGVWVKLGAKLVKAVMLGLLGGTPTRNPHDNRLAAGHCES